MAQPDGTNVFEFSFDPADPVFAGHFPGRPILPGVFQLEMARMASEWTRGGKLAVLEVVKSKFQRPILPGALVRLVVKITDADGAMQARAVFTIEGQQAGETLLRLSPCA